ncbi:hypothetical protein RHGRI_031681 [Rhododendron griersonianum]|uniref:Uncharacterized protein n=1 Tax=Rhododendron griersonianum TaxID=479676 RepID=A0AAV6I983_9ERIC|nr:hypothetical protein RHGRI_031681 [Rhododendron griersonianum]
MLRVQDPNIDRFVLPRRSIILLGISLSSFGFRTSRSFASPERRETRKGGGGREREKVVSVAIGGGGGRKWRCKGKQPPHKICSI